MSREEKNAHVIAALRLTIERLQSGKGSDQALRDQLHALSIVGDGRRDLKESPLPTRRRKSA